MRQLTIAALMLATAGAASAQNAPIGPGIPNGLSGPGGTETFTPSPTVPNLSTPGALSGARAGNAGRAGQAGAISGTIHPRRRAR